MDLPKLVFGVSGVGLVLAVGFGLGIHAAEHKTPLYATAAEAAEGLAILRDPAAREKALMGARAEHLQPSRGQGAGVVVNERMGDGARILMAGFFDAENQVRLVARDGTVERRWSLDYFAHFPDPATRPCQHDDPLMVDLHGVHLTPEGDLVVNYEYCGTVKLDACGGLVWALEHHTHHSVTASERGGYWILGRESWVSTEAKAALPPFTESDVPKLIEEDLILKVSEDGRIEAKWSLPRLLYAAGLGHLVDVNAIRADGTSRSEIVHANKITELPAALAHAFPMFDAGDLAVSMRQLNLIVVLDGETMAPKWHQVGPWLRQHDPEFRPDGRISVFDNATHMTGYDAQGQTRRDWPRTTRILAMDPATREVEQVYGGPGQEMLSVIRGQHELLGDGGMLIAEFDAGRVLEVDASGRVVWDYVNAVGEAHVGEIANALLIPEDERPGGGAICP